MNTVNITVHFWVLVIPMSPFLTHPLRCWVEMVATGFIPSHYLLQETFPVCLVLAENFHPNPHVILAWMHPFDALAATTSTTTQHARVAD
jgi:hypothetical protein